MRADVMLAIDALQEIVDRGGPTRLEYERIGQSITVLHDAEYLIENGLGRRAAPSSQVDDFFSRNRAVFGTTASMQGFVKCRPHGYAGDFEVIEKIYTQSVSALPAIRLWDEFFHTSQATEAVRNRAAVFAALVEEFAPQDLLSVACGPGLDVAAALRDGESPVVRATLLDNDPNALRRASVNLATSPLDIDYREGNALRYRPDRPHGLVWCSGLFDYLSDRASVLLLRRLYDALAPGGVLAVGNFATGQASRAYMETVGHWLLIHRSEEDIRSLAAAAGVPPQRTEVRTDDTGVNLFLIAHA